MESTRRADVIGLLPDPLAVIASRQAAILEAVRARGARYIKTLDAEQVGLPAIGSAACIVVDMPAGGTMLDLSYMSEDISALAGLPVDVMTSDMLPSRLRDACDPISDEVCEGVDKILRAIVRIRGYVGRMDRDGFLEDCRTQDAVAYNLRIIASSVLGVTDVPGVASAHPTLERWHESLSSAFAGDYDVDWALVWSTMQRDLPALDADIRQVVGVDSATPSTSACVRR